MLLHLPRASTSPARRNPCCSPRLAPTYQSDRLRRAGRCIRTRGARAAARGARAYPAILVDRRWQAGQRQPGRARPRRGRRPRPRPAVVQRPAGKPASARSRAADREHRAWSAHIIENLRRQIAVTATNDLASSNASSWVRGRSGYHRAACGRMPRSIAMPMRLRTRRWRARADDDDRHVRTALDITLADSRWRRSFPPTRRRLRPCRPYEDRRRIGQLSLSRRLVAGTLSFCRRRVKGAIWLCRPISAFSNLGSGRVRSPLGDHPRCLCRSKDGGCSRTPITGATSSAPAIVSFGRWSATTNSCRALGEALAHRRGRGVLRSRTDEPLYYERRSESDRTNLDSGSRSSAIASARSSETVAILIRPRPTNADAPRARRRPRSRRAARSSDRGRGSLRRRCRSSSPRAGRGSRWRTDPTTSRASHEPGERRLPLERADDRLITWASRCAFGIPRSGLREMFVRNVAATAPAPRRTGAPSTRSSGTGCEREPGPRSRRL